MTATIHRLPTAAPPDPVSEIQRRLIMEWSEVDQLIAELQRHCAAAGKMIIIAKLSEVRTKYVEKRIADLKGD